MEVRCTSRTVKKNTLVTAHATVTIVDTTGDTVQEATVSGTWSGATTDSDTGDMNDDGQVTLSSNEVKVTSSATFTFTVNAVSYTIPWDGNTESGTITYTK